MLRRITAQLPLPAARRAQAPFIQGQQATVCLQDDQTAVFMKRAKELGCDWSLPVVRQAWALPNTAKSWHW